MLKLQEMLKKFNTFSQLNKKLLMKGFFKNKKF